MTDPQSRAPIPADFPTRIRLTAIAGAQPKLAVMRGSDGKYHTPGPSPEEIRADYEMCEDLAQQLVAYCRKKLPIFRSRKTTLVEVFRGVLHKQWCSPEQTFWTIQRAAVLLEWPVPKGHVERRTGPGLRF
jgi:hypothetical protein